MSRAAHTRLGPAGTIGAGQPEQAAPANSVFGSGGGWAWGYATLTGIRHRQQPEGVCEDAALVKLLPPEAVNASGVHASLADGVSGGAMGRVCAQSYVKFCSDFDPQGNVSLPDWIGVHADPHVQAALRQYTQAPGATTGVAAWIDAQGMAQINRIGDCRAYLWNVAPDNTIMVQQIQTDQTMQAMGLVEPGNPHAHQPAHMVGNDNVGVPEFVVIQMPAAGAGGILLCSDGLHDVIDAQALTGHLQGVAHYGATMLAQWCDGMARQAQQQGSDDDVAVLVLCRSTE